LFKDTKSEKYFKLLLTFNDESKRHIVMYKTKFDQAMVRQVEQVQYVQERQARGSSVQSREISTGGGSRARQSMGRDMTPGKIGKAIMLQTNTSLTAMDTNIVNVKSGQTGRNIKTPQTLAQNGQS